MSTTSTALHDARALRDIARKGRSYRNDEVYHPHTIDEGAEADLAGNGLDVIRTLQIPNPTRADSNIEVYAALRVLCKPNNNLCIRVRIDWTSPFGKHSSHAEYDMGDGAMERLATMKTFAEQEAAAVATLDYDEAVALLDQHMTLLELFGAQWHQKYPEISREAMKHHMEVVDAARLQLPAMLSMLTDEDLGGVYPEGITQMLSWLREQPEASGLI